MNSMCLWYALGTLVFAFRPDAISDIDYEFTTYTPHAQFTQMMSNPQHYYCLKSNILYFKQETSHSYPLTMEISGLAKKTGFW